MKYKAGDKLRTLNNKCIILIILILTILNPTMTYASYSDKVVNWAKSEKLLTNDSTGNFRLDDYLKVGEAYCIIYKEFTSKNVTETQKTIDFAISEHWASKYANEMIQYLNTVDFSNDLDSDIEIGLAMKLLFEASKTEIYHSNLFQDIDVGGTLRYRNYLKTAYLMGLIDSDDIKNTKITRGKFIETLYKVKHSEYEQIKLPGYLENLKIYYDADMKYSEIKNSKLLIEAEIAKIPKFIIENFNDEGWHIDVTDKYLIDFYGDKDLANAVGLIHKGYKVIGLSFKDTLPDSTIEHEFGHYTHYKFYNTVDDTGLKLKTAFDTEASRLGVLKNRYYCETSEHEFFAEAFQHYISSQGNQSDIDKFKENCPIIYSILNNIIETNTTIDETVLKPGLNARNITT